MDFGINVLNMQGLNFAFSARMVHTETGVILWSASVNQQQGGIAVLKLAERCCRSIAEQIRNALKEAKAKPA